MRFEKHVAVIFCVLATVAVPVAQSKPASRPAPADRDAITLSRVTKIVHYLSSDELGGRNTPSPGLKLAARYLADNFKQAGLKPGGGKGSFFHNYERSGQSMDTADVELALLRGEKRKVLKPGKDFRVFAASAEYERDEAEVILVKEANAAKRLGRSFPRRPVLIAVPKGSQLWASTPLVRTSLSRRGFRSRAPVLLVREELLPRSWLQEEGEEDEEAEEDAELLVAVKVPAPKRVQLDLENVVAILPGKEKPDEYVMFSAHYDHLGTATRFSQGGDTIYNGADDDASGTTAVLVLAEAYAKAKKRPKCSLLFVCFSGEEKRFLGSRAFAKEPPVPLATIRVDLNIEMIGRPLRGNKKAAWVTGKTYSDFEKIVAVGFKRAGIRIVNFPQAMMLFRASDNWPLASKGIVAHSISAGSLHKDYHKPSDEFEKLDLPHMTAVIKGIYEAGLEFANRKERPKFNARARRRLGLDR